MADYNMVMSQAEISTLKETLHAQQQLLQRLYNELDAEREASASAASEALSVILRLQGEKAAIKMEAEHYKRLSEEKISHAEESLEIIEDIIYQKEMEAAALDYQVQAYRYKLMSMGCVDPGAGGIGEIKYPDNLLQRNEGLAPDTSMNSLGRRNSAPSFLKGKKGMIERESSTSPETDFVSKIVEEQTEQEVNDQASDSDKKTDFSASGNINCYWEQIKKLDERVQEIAGGNYGNLKNEERSPSSLSSRPSAGSLCDSSNSVNFVNLRRSTSPHLSIANTYDPKKVTFFTEIERIKSPGTSLKEGSGVDHPCSPNIHDVFEVPQVDQDRLSRESSTKEKRKIAFLGSKNLEREHPIHPEAVKLHAKEEPDWLKKLLESTHRGNNLCKPSDIAAMDCQVAIVQTSTIASESQPRLSQLNRTSEIVEVERTAEVSSREEEMKLLNDIKEQLNSLQDEIRHFKVKEPCTRDEPSLCPLSEAMLYFWL